MLVVALLSPPERQASHNLGMHGTTTKDTCLLLFLLRRKPKKKKTENESCEMRVEVFFRNVLFSPLTAHFAE